MSDDKPSDFMNKSLIAIMCGYDFITGDRCVKIFNRFGDKKEKILDDYELKELRDQLNEIIKWKKKK